MQPPLRPRVAPPGEPGSASLGRYFSPETALSFFPGEHRNGSGIDLAQTLFDAKPARRLHLPHGRRSRAANRQGVRVPPVGVTTRPSKARRIFPHILIILLQNATRLSRFRIAIRSLQGVGVGRTKAAYSPRSRSDEGRRNAVRALHWGLSRSPRFPRKSYERRPSNCG